MLSPENKEFLDVAHALDAHARYAHERFREDARLLAKAYDADVYLVVLRADRLVVGMQDAEARHEGGPRRRGLEEVSAA